MITLELTPEKLQLLFQSLDTHVRANGLAVAGPVAGLVKEMQTAAEKEKVTEDK